MESPPELKTKPRSKEHVLSRQQVTQLKEACTTPEEKLIVYTLIYTGMRVSEFLHLNKEWINWQTEQIMIPLSIPCPCSECKKIHKTKRYKNKFGNVVEPKISKLAGLWRCKTPDSKRNIGIVPELLPLFEDYFKTHHSIMEQFNSRITIWRILKRVYKRTSIKLNVFPHSMRSTFASLASESIDNSVDLKNLLGWKDIGIAQYYVKMSSERVKKITDSIKGKW